jgi:hypothetical protein
MGTSRTRSRAAKSKAAERYERNGDLERRLAGVGLRDEQVVDVHPELSGVLGIERVFGIDDGIHAARPLSLGDDVLD